MKPRFVVVAFFAASALLFARDAHADTKAECFSASEKAQQLRDDRKFLKAREQFLTCARDACPAAVKKDCGEQVAELDKRTPSVVVRAKDKNGQDLVSVKVTSDGAPLTDQLDGRAILLDPGVHTFRFEAPGNEPLEQKVLLAEGERARPVTATFGATALASGGGGGAEHAKKGLPIGAFVVGGLGIVAMGVGGAFYGIALGQKSTDESATGCKPNCTPSEVDSIRTKLVIGDIAFYTGVAALTVGVVWMVVHYASGNKEAASPPAAMIDVGPTTYGRGAIATTTIRW